jgi:hypothetical protein
MVVEQKHWMSATEFTDMLGLCQFLPGGNIMNVTVALGARRHHSTAPAITAGAAGNLDLAIAMTSTAPGTIAAVATALFLFTRLHLLLVLGAAAALGAPGC